MKIEVFPVKIAVLGLGNMGSVMSRQLVLGGFEVTGFDPIPEAAAKAAGFGVKCCSCAREAAEGADVVLCMMPLSSDTQQALFGQDGAASVLTPGKIVLDMGTGSPTATKEMCARLKERGIAFLDAPVSGGVKKASDGTLSIMAAGDKAAVDRVMPVLQCLGADVFYVGESGTGHTIKLINNMLTGINLVGACEGMMLGMKAGIDPELLLKIINSSSGESYSSRVKIPNFVFKRNFSGGFKTRLQHKDMNLATGLAKDLCVPVPMGNLAKEMFEAAMAAGYADEDCSSVIKILERVEDLEVKPRTQA